MLPLKLDDGYNDWTGAVSVLGRSVVDIDHEGTTVQGNGPSVLRGMASREFEIHRISHFECARDMGLQVSRLTGQPPPRMPTLRTTMFRGKTQSIHQQPQVMP